MTIYILCGPLDLAIHYHNDGYCRNVWITMGGARWLDRKRLVDRIEKSSFKLIVLEISHNTCREHIKNDITRGSWQLWDPRIKKWWNDYQPGKGDIIVSTNELENFSIFPKEEKPG
ncbi:MAG: hypothetical protein ACYCYC_06290 [Bellilinea sp.]